MWNFADSMGRTGLDVLGFHVEATDGVIGTIDEVSALPGCAYIVVDTASWLSGTKRLLPAGVVQSVNENRRAVRVALSKKEIRSAPKFSDQDRESPDLEYDKYYRRISG